MGPLNAAAKYTERRTNGIVAAAPTRNMAGLISGWANAGQQKAPSPAKLTSMYQARVVQCDLQDGVADGVISDPAACRFEVAALRCSEGADNDSCLTGDEVEAVNAIRSDIRLANDRMVYSRLGIGGNPLGEFRSIHACGPTRIADVRVISQRRISS